MAERSLHLQELNHLIRACREESRQNREYEKGYCFELFRRALDEKDQAAWDAIDRQYFRLIFLWVREIETLPADEAEDLARESLRKFWRTLTKQAPPLTGRFDHVGAILKYLHQCTVTTVLDHRRQTRRQTKLNERLRQVETAMPFSEGLGESAIDRLAREEQIKRIQAWINENVVDPQERHLLFLAFECDLSPAEIADMFPDEFPDSRTVRRIKERVLKRCRRAFGSRW